MKKAISTALCLISLLLLCSCGAKDQNDMKITKKTEPVNVGTVVLVNEIKDADIWILPMTAENLKTTLWGTATVRALETGKRAGAPLCEPGPDGLYIFRMIDSGSFYYSANSLVLNDGYTLTVKEDETGRAFLEIADGSGNLTETAELFSARL